MSNVIHLGHQVANLLRLEKEQEARDLVRNTLINGYTKPYMTEIELDASVDWWISQTKNWMQQYPNEVV